MSRSDFERLDVYRLAARLGDLCWNVVEPWPKEAVVTLGRQLRRAADSIAANIAEGTGQGSYASNRHFVRIARGSLYETRHWLGCAYRRGLLEPEDVTRVSPLLSELTPRLNAYLRSIGRKPSEDNSLREPDGSYAFALQNPADIDPFRRQPTTDN